MGGVRASPSLWVPLEAAGGLPIRVAIGNPDERAVFSRNHPGESMPGVPSPIFWGRFLVLGPGVKKKKKEKEESVNITKQMFYFLLSVACAASIHKTYHTGNKRVTDGRVNVHIIVS